ncbi:hypothetical protein HNY73_016641 [Argiope bruennichi]|uniref:Uncharacterized protein n=1 Tax=Argiope bruennichi TaxID=94029 RepID=A0A8T0EJE7_ARGBR|nr:hypothetical protein HNY73_016641 [Argiope bruennichi]
MNKYDSSLLFRFWDDNPKDAGRTDRCHLLWVLRLLGGHPVLQPVPGANHHIPRLHSEDAARERSQKKGILRRTARLTAVLRLQLRRVEALGLLGDVVPVSGHHHHRHECLLPLQPHGRVDLPGLSVLLLCHLLDHRLRGPGHFPGASLPAHGALPGGQFALHRVRIGLKSTASLTSPPLSSSSSSTGL